MTPKTLSERFEKFEDEFVHFERVENKMSSRPDLHAFLLLDKLQPGTRDMISSSEHDEVWLDIDCNKLAAVITDDQVLELVRCGIRHDGVFDSLCMFS